MLHFAHNSCVKRLSKGSFLPARELKSYERFMHNFQQFSSFSSFAVIEQIFMGENFFQSWRGMLNECELLKKANFFLLLGVLGELIQHNEVKRCCWKELKMKTKRKSFQEST
jgi:hypothetical protein